MSHTIQNQKKILTRIRRIKGQVEGLERLLLSKHECNKVLQQIAAIRGATNGLMMDVLESHMREHLGADDIPPAQRQQELVDVMAILKSYLK
ncbi:metal/formaldehyde-sensitive transcriptional repressor [Zhongshania guokunii]|jgi:DNA-binding FrmR family transcriptional regulator|uniref:Metal/formaldehyde-sensitive transcriptional repressor n=1 Tax=Zhongshania guokunii TaxID=641783 RepID=A0ABV3U8N5_9GAMM